MLKGLDDGASVNPRNGGGYQGNYLGAIERGVAHSL